MMPRRRTSGHPPAAGPAPGVLLLPALAVVLLLFGGGLVLGVIQAMGYLPAAGLDGLGFGHFRRVLGDPDFLTSLGLTFAVSAVSTVVAAALGVASALALLALAGRFRAVHFIFQVPLTVPHLVIAVAAVFLLSPTGLLSRFALAVGLIDSSAQFPLLVNDRWGIGIMAVYVWKEVPFIALMILAALKNAGTELIEVGRTLKAGPWQRFRFIILPLILPGLGAASLIAFAYTFGAFEVPYLLGRTYPLTLPVWAFKHYADVDLTARPEGIATGIIIAVIVGTAVVLSQFAARAAGKRGGSP